MAKKTIPELPDGTTTQTSAAVVAFDEAGTTFRGTIRPNPTQEINILNQQQLEDELGSDIIIPDATNVTIVIDGSFTLTKPIKIGDGSGLHLIFSTIGPQIDWTGAGAMNLHQLKLCLYSISQRRYTNLSYRLPMY